MLIDAMVVLIAGPLSFLLSLLLTPRVASFFRNRGLGQPIHDDMPAEHQAKSGTPTMGGTVIVGASIVAYLVAHLAARSWPSVSGLLLLLLLLGLGLVGFIDDYLKVSSRRNLGLRGRTKFIGQVVVGVVFGVLALNFPDGNGFTPASDAISFVRDLPGVSIGVVLFVIWALFIISAASNGVNLADGLDGLATGCCTLVFGGYTLITLWQARQACNMAINEGCYVVRDAGDLAAFSFALFGACAGFLWWNTHPARIFLGDVGALPLGGALGGLAIMTHTELLLVIVGGLFVAANGSVIIQRGFFKLSRRLTGTPRRVFLMSPIQFHFQLKGWPESTIVTRFWVVCGALVTAGLGIFYGDWLLHV
jgi:phospho-N-acetylmuramoyl-pentapeptide-transferase